MKEVLLVYQEVMVQNQAGGAVTPGVAPPVVTVSIDEKSGVQAIENTAPDLPPVPIKSKAELKERILLGIAEINAAPVVHRWKKFDLLTA